MPMQRELYPDNWDEIAHSVKAEADWKCEECGMQCRRSGEPFDTHRRTLTVSHQNHDPSDNRRENLKALCSACHLRYDAKHHAESRRKNSERKKAMRTMKLYDGEIIGYYDEGDLAECRVCHVKPIYKDGARTNGACYVRCPVCGIKTGTSTMGLEGVLPVWNAIMDDNWPESDPKKAIGD